MPGLADIVMQTAPIAGGALLGLAAGNLRGSDVRELIKQDLDLLDRLPPEQAERRAELQRTIGMRIDDLITATDRSQALREAAAAYRGGWRDIVLFVCTVLFTIVWWHVKHSRTNWPVVFIVLILLSVITAGYAARGLLKAVRALLHSRVGRSSAR